MRTTRPSQFLSTPWGRLGSLAATLALLATGCGKDSDDYGYGGGGENKYYSSSDDTGSGGGDGADSDAPEITNFTVTLEDYADLGDVFELKIYYTDPNGDFPYDTVDTSSGGSVQISLTDANSNTTDETVEASSLGDFSDEGYVQAAISPDDTSVSHTISVVIIDAAGNASSAATAEYTPTE